MFICRIPKTLLASATLLSFLLASPPLSAQAWLPPKGEGNFTFSYQNLFVRNHFDEKGHRVALGHIRASAFVQRIEYGLTDRMAVDLSLPYISSKYYGDFPHKLPIDDGTYHSAFQDFQVGLRRNLCMRPLVLTPFVEGVIPSHHYEYFAHSAVGSDLREFRVGMNAGRRLDPLLPKAYFQARYSFAVVERTIGIRPLRQRLESEFGYFVTRRFSVSALESLQVTHHGLNLPSGFTNQNFPFHDKIANIGFFNIGLGASVAATRSVEFFGSALTTVWGRNGHSLHNGLTLGVNWNFRTRRFLRQAFSSSKTKKCNKKTCVICRKCERLFQEPDSVKPALLPR